MHKSRFADAKPGRTLDQLTSQLRSRCALIGQNRLKAEVQRAGDSPREVPNSTGLCKTHTYTTIFSPVFGISVSQDWTALVSKTQIGILTVTRMKVRRQSLSRATCGRRRSSPPPAEWAQPRRWWSSENTELWGMGLEVRFKVLEGCVCDGFQRYRGFTACVALGGSSIHYWCCWWTRVRLRASPFGGFGCAKVAENVRPALRKRHPSRCRLRQWSPTSWARFCKCVGQLGAINGDRGSRSDEALTQMWISSRWHGWYNCQCSFSASVALINPQEDVCQSSSISNEF